MDLANSDVVRETPLGLCDCYKASDLDQTILDSTDTANFKDRYVLGHQLGWGKFGIIRECTDKLTGELLACKSIAKERLITTDDVLSVKLEIQIMTRLSGHLNVVDLKAVYEDNDYVHIVMEFCAGGELFHQIDEHGRFSESVARVLFRQLIEVVVFCHDKGIVHRDLKPENILLVSRSSSSPIKLADFGLATYVQPGQKLNVTVGSPFYIAPEVLSGGYNQAADIWSAGVILYILLSGMPPFWGKTKSEIFDAVRAAKLRFHPHLWDHISASAKDLITKMLCMDPSKRFTAAQILDHPWMKHSEEEAYNQSSGQRSLPSQCIEGGNGSVSVPFMSRDEDYSFAEGSPATSDENGDVSPVFTCRSSFSSFLVNHTPCSISGGFSFGSSYESSTLEFSSPLPSMPSFTFFSPGLGDAQDDECSSLKDKQLSTSEESSSGQMFVLPEPPHESVQRRFHEMDYSTQFLRGSGSSVFKITSISAKRRNHTIGVGELQLDQLATESFIRWASCTHISSATSLRSSLVC